MPKKAPRRKNPARRQLVGPVFEFREVLLCVSGGFGSFSGRDLGLTLESPTDFVALGSGAGLTNGASDGALMGATAAHFLEDALGIELCFKAFQGAIDALSTFDFNATSMFFHDK